MTNGPPRQEEKICRTGLAEAIDVGCISEVLGVRKPDAEILQQAARRCGIPLRGWMTGDSAEADIAGGIRAGLRTIWLSRSRTWQHADYGPHSIANSLTEAIEPILSGER